MSTLKTTNLQHASAASPAIVLASDGSATAQLSSLNGGALSGARNRIINGDMRIDQRNAGASITGNSGVFPADRWQTYATQSSKFTCQQSTTAPTGFTNSLLYTSLSAYSVTSSDYFSVTQRIEGFNCAGFNFGTANATALTLSFWVRSSLTGTFGGACHNNAFNRAYPFTYTITSANTWEYKTVSIAGDTSGTWTTDNSVGLEIGFSLGCGSTGLATAGAWTGTSNIYGATGQVNVVGTNGATFYITGVQLEAGSVATPFERRSYGQELALCQRYYWKTPDINSIVFNGNYNHVQFKVSMRATPTITLTPGGGTISDVRSNTEGFQATCSATTNATAIASIEL